jgi:hypothetical protein
MTSVFNYELIVDQIRRQVATEWPSATNVYVAGSWMAKLAAHMQNTIWRDGGLSIANDIDVYLMDANEGFRQKDIEILQSYYTSLKIENQHFEINWVEIKPMYLTNMLKTFDLNCCRVGMDISDAEPREYVVCQLDEFAQFLTNQVIKPVFPIKNHVESTIRLLFKAWQLKLSYVKGRLNPGQGTLTPEGYAKLSQMRQANAIQPEFLRGFVLCPMDTQGWKLEKRYNEISSGRASPIKTHWGRQVFGPGTTTQVAVVGPGEAPSLPYWAADRSSADGVSNAKQDHRGQPQHNLRVKRSKHTEAEDSFHTP